MLLRGSCDALEALVKEDETLRDKTDVAFAVRLNDAFHLCVDMKEQSAIATEVCRVFYKHGKSNAQQQGFAKTDGRWTEVRTRKKTLEESWRIGIEFCFEHAVHHALTSHILT
jgi:hypothetical protein